MGLVGLWHGFLNGNLMNVGRELVGARNVGLITGFEAFGSGVGGLCGPPIISKWINVVYVLFMHCSPIWNVKQFLIRAFFIHMSSASNVPISLWGNTLHLKYMWPNSYISIGQELLYVRGKHQMTLDLMHEYRNLLGTTKFTDMIMVYNCSRDDPFGPVTVLQEEDRKSVV